MPVRRTIHSSLVSSPPARSSLVTIASGRAAPTPNRPALWVPFADTLRRSNTAGDRLARVFDVPAGNVEPLWSGADGRRPQARAEHRILGRWAAARRRGGGRRSRTARLRLDVGGRG